MEKNLEKLSIEEMSEVTAGGWATDLMCISAAVAYVGACMTAPATLGGSLVVAGAAGATVAACYFAL